MKMPYSRRWEALLAKSYGKQAARQVITDARRRYEEYLNIFTGSGLKSVDKTLVKRVYPILAIYKSLEEALKDPEEAFSQVEMLFREGVFGAMLAGMRMINHLPQPFPLIRSFMRLSMQAENFPGSQTVVEDSPDCFAVTTYRCFIHETLTALGEQQLTRIFCNSDDWLSKAMPKISWQRTATIGRGEAFCDFRWCRAK